MLLSDRDILAAQADGHISLDPWTPEMVQPASIDVRLDRFFRLFNNHTVTDATIMPAGECSTELTGITCYENGQALPNDGFITLNRGLELGDKVLMLRVQHGQKYVVLSRVFQEV